VPNSYVGILGYRIRIKKRLFAAGILTSKFEEALNGFGAS
jgi:hypothetical protein